MTFASENCAQQHNRLREMLSYDPETGQFVWRVRCGRAGAGTVAGSNHTNGYRHIKWDEVLHAEHRLAWFYMTGEWPVGDIDHINREKADNRWVNLRLATRAQNIANTPLRKNNTSGFKGVTQVRGRWSARITVNDKTRHLGVFDTPEDAYRVYREAAKEFFGDFLSTEVCP